VSLPGAALEWEGGGQARFVSLSGDGVAIVSTSASPPGSRPVGVLFEEPRARVRLKVHACRALGDGTFRLEGRLLDVTREMRARLDGFVVREES
jgi:hypothetical protein